MIDAQSKNMVVLPYIYTSLRYTHTKTSLLSVISVECANQLDQIYYATVI